LKKKINKFQDLANLDVYIEDRFNEYIKVYNVPDMVGTGKHSFLIDVASNKLVKDSELFIELLDSNKNIIYTEIPKYREGYLRRVSMIIYDDAENGEALLTIVGIAKNVPKI